MSTTRMHSRTSPIAPPCYRFMDANTRVAAIAYGVV
jgi:hypothetical protein